MPLKIQLVKDGKIIHELPLTLEGWDSNQLRSELEDLEAHLPGISTILDVFSNTTRTRMLSEIVQNPQRRFSELMQSLRANQKIIMENLRMMMEADLVERVEHTPKNIRYSPSNKGVAGLLTCVVMCRIMDEIEKNRR